MRDITANKKPTVAQRLNSISGLQIQFDKLKKETGLLCGAIPLQVAFESPLAARPVQPKVLADKGIEAEIEPKMKSKNSNIKMFWTKRISQLKQVHHRLKWQE